MSNNKEPFPPSIFTSLETFDGEYQKLYYIAIGATIRKWCSIEEYMLISLRCAGIDNVTIYNKSDLLRLCESKFGKEWASFCI